TFEGCSVVLATPSAAKRAVVVILPLTCSFPQDGPQQLARSEQASRLTPLLQRLHQPPGECVCYYLACAPSDLDGRPAELALAAATLGWPTGNVVLLPPRASRGEVLAEGLDRLRWLLAGSLDLLVLNLEPEVDPLLNGNVQAKPDRAGVVRMARSGGDPWALLDGLAHEPGSGASWRSRPLRAGRVTRYPIV